MNLDASTVATIAMTAAGTTVVLYGMVLVARIRRSGDLGRLLARAVVDGRTRSAILWCLGALSAMFVTLGFVLISQNFGFLSDAQQDVLSAAVYLTGSATLLYLTQVGMALSHLSLDNELDLRDQEPEVFDALVGGISPLAASPVAMYAAYPTDSAASVSGRSSGTTAPLLPWSRAQRSPRGRAPSPGAGVRLIRADALAGYPMKVRSAPRLFRLLLPARNLERSRKFYESLLGAKGRSVARGRVYFDCGPVILGVLDYSSPEAGEPTSPTEALYFSTDDLEGVHRRARTLGCLSKELIHGDPRSPAGAIVVRPWGERSFYVIDPSGNPLCFVDARTLFTGTPRQVAALARPRTHAAVVRRPRRRPSAKAARTVRARR